MTDPPRIVRLMRWWLVPALCLVAAANADAGVNKCVDAQGNVTLTDRPCPSSSRQQTVEVQADEPKTESDVSSPGTSSRSDRFERQLDRGMEQLEAKRRDLDSRCSRGDKEACSDATCMLIYTEGATAELYRDCSRANGFKFNSSWAQMSAVHVLNGSRTIVNVTCLQHPQVLRFGAKEVKVFSTLRLQAENRPTGFHDRNRFYTNMLGGPDFASWEEAATTLCDPVAAAKARKSVKEKL